MINCFADMVDAFDTTVNSLNERYHTNLANAMRWAGKAAASTTPDKAAARRSPRPRWGRVKANLQPEYDAALRQLDLLRPGPRK